MAQAASVPSAKVGVGVEVEAAVQAICIKVHPSDIGLL